MSKKMILIAGASASGKTSYCKHIEQVLKLPVISKDSIKEIMYDGMKFDVSTQKQGQLLGAGSYCLLYYFAEQLMKAGIDFVLESNFVEEARKTLTSLAEQYDYESFLILFDAPVEILHQRFIDREMRGQRHAGLGKCVYDDFEKFRKVAEKQRTFSFGEKTIRVDTLDFSKVNYEKIDREISAFHQSSVNRSI